MNRNTHRLSFPKVYLMSMIIFIGLVAFLSMILLANIQTFFFTNPGLNGLILGVLAVGVILAFQQVLRLVPEILWVNAIQKGRMKRNPMLLAPMAEAFKDEDIEDLALSTLSSQSILDSIGNRLDERREISRYLISLLVFLGLLGTFWGLLQTIGSIGETIQTLDPELGSTNEILDSLKVGLSSPLEGMGTAFSSSLFGLAGSLVLGFLDLQAGQAQNRFFLELENWTNSIIDRDDDMGQTSSARNSKIDNAIAKLADGMHRLVKQMKEEQHENKKWRAEREKEQNYIQKVIKKIDDAIRK